MDVVTDILKALKLNIIFYVLMIPFNQIKSIFIK